MRLQALYIISLPCVNSNWSYSLETAKLGLDLCHLDLWPLTLTFAWTSLLSIIVTLQFVPSISVTTGTTLTGPGQRVRHVHQLSGQKQDNTGMTLLAWKIWKFMILMKLFPINLGNILIQLPHDCASSVNRWLLKHYGFTSKDDHRRSNDEQCDVICV